MGSRSWFSAERIRSAVVVVVADRAAWRSRLRTLLLGPVPEEPGRSVVCGMGLLISVDPEPV